MLKKSLLNRLRDLETDLTPKQVIMRYLERMTACHDIDAWLQEAYSDKFIQWADEIRENLSESTLQRLKKQSPQEINKGYRKTRQEFFYLFSLMLSPCQNFETDRYRYMYQFACLVYIYGKLLEIERKGFSEMPDEVVRQDVLQMKVVGERLLSEMTADRLTEAKISQRFFDGKPLFLSEQKAFLDERIMMLERLMGNVTDFLTFMQWILEEKGGKKGRAKAMEFVKGLSPDLERVQKEAEAQANVQFEHAEQDAKISVYDSEDRFDDAVKIIQKIFRTKG